MNLCYNERKQKIYLVNKGKYGNDEKSTKSERYDVEEQNTDKQVSNHNLIYLNPIKKIILHGCRTR